jgi:CTP synthase
VGVQFHPELKSRPTRAHPLFAGFIGAAVRAKHAFSESRTAPSRARSTS